MTSRRTAARGGHLWPTMTSGFFLVVLAAATWGTDLFFRVKLSVTLPAPAIVFAEHLVLVAVTLPLLVRALRTARNFTARDWVAIVFVGAGASALATVLFTSALEQGDPPSAYLLQQLQPLVAALGARWLLGEKLHGRYWIFFLAAVAGAYLVNFADPLAVDPKSLAAGLLAVGAAVLWASGTVFGRQLTGVIGSNELTALRFGVGLPVTALILLVDKGPSGFTSYPSSSLVGLVFLALIPGLLAMLIYYRGLRSTPAAAATIGELALPMSILLIASTVYGFTLTGTQWVGLILLTGTMTYMGLASQRSTEKVGIEPGAEVERDNLVAAS